MKLKFKIPNIWRENKIIKIPAAIRNSLDINNNILPTAEAVAPKIIKTNENPNANKIVFIILGATASAVGNILLFISNELRIAAGILIILFSLQMLGILNFNFLNQDKRIETKGYKDNYAFPLLVGAAFAFGWTPCIGPVLGSILALSATEASIGTGVLFLSFYSLGLAIPFILSGYYMNSFLISKKGFGKYYNRITKTGGSILLITGILIATNQIQVISYYILTTFPFLTSLGWRAI